MLFENIYIYIYIVNIDEGVQKLLISATFIRQLVSVRFTFHYQVYLSEELRQIKVLFGYQNEIT